MSDTRRFDRKPSGEHPLPLCEKRIAQMEQCLDEYSDRFTAIDARLARGEVLFAEIKKDIERLTEAVNGIRSVLVWIGGIVGTGIFGAVGAALLWAIRSMSS